MFPLALALAWFSIPADGSWWSIEHHSSVANANDGSFALQQPKRLEMDDLNDLLELPQNEDEDEDEDND